MGHSSLIRNSIGRWSITVRPAQHTSNKAFGSDNDKAVGAKLQCWSARNYEQLQLCWKCYLLV